MISLFVCILLATADAGLKDLGVLSPLTMIPLQRNTEREDFHHFMVEVMPSFRTNQVVKFTTTNEFISLSDLTALPSGRMILGLRSVSAAGLESAVSLFTFTVWRSERMPQPGAGTVVVRSRASLGTNRMKDLVEGDETLMRTYRRFRSSSTRRYSPPPPLPPGLTQVMSVGDPEPLPNGTNKTYAVHLDEEAEKEMHKFYNRTGRRNQ